MNSICKYYCTDNDRKHNMNDRIFHEYKRNFQPKISTEQVEDSTGKWAVYEFAIYLAERSGAKTIIDIGVSNGSGLKAAVGKYRLIGIDCLKNDELFKRNLPSATLHKTNLNEIIPRLDDDVIENSIIICSNLIHRLTNIDVILEWLSKLSKSAKYLLVCTPDRIRTRGSLCFSPPDNDENVREWTLDEFFLLFKDYNFTHGVWGHTWGSSDQSVKPLIVYLGGREVDYKRPCSQLRICGVVSSYNDEDIIHETVTHYLNEGLHVHVIDNWSQDSTLDIVKSMAKTCNDITYESFPDIPQDYFDLVGQLDRKLSYSLKNDYHWYIHIDSDEIRLSPFGYTIYEAISFIDSIGYNAIDFTVIDFRPTDLNNHNIPQMGKLEFFEFGKDPYHFLQIKGWKNGNYSGINLSESGGHQIQFKGRKIYPLKFLLKHYPLRSKEQIDRKIYKERLPRFQKERAERGWHTHYDNYKEQAQYVWQESDLIRYKKEMFCTEFMIERLSGIGIKATQAYQVTSGKRLLQDAQTIQLLQNQLHAISNSWSWRITKPLRMPGKLQRWVSSHIVTRH
jgi:hypothetical protein